MVKFLLWSLIAALSAHGAQSAVAVAQCDGICEDLVDQTCDQVAFNYDFSGDCCSVVQNANDTCTLITTSTCNKKGRLSRCKGNFEKVSCSPPTVTNFIANTTTDVECPESAIDLLNQVESLEKFFPVLALELESITTLDDDQIEQWRTTTSDHIIAYFSSNPDVGLLDVLSEITYGSFNGSDTRNAITVAYSHSISWRPADADVTVDEIMAQKPFEPGNAGDYITSLNEGGILATAVSIVIVEHDDPNATESNETDAGSNATTTDETTDQTKPDDDSESGFPPCNICGDGKELGNPQGEPVDKSGNPMPKCYELEAVASRGGVSPEDCKTYPSQVDKACNCTVPAAEPVENKTTTKSAAASLGCFKLASVILAVASFFSI